MFSPGDPKLNSLFLKQLSESEHFETDYVISRPKQTINIVFIFMIEYNIADIINLERCITAPYVTEKHKLIEDSLKSNHF